MNFGELKTEFTQRAPDSPASTTQQGIWANLGAKDIARRTKCLSTNGSLNIVASTQEYDLISNFSTFLGIDPDGGVHYYDGSDYMKLKAVSKNWLDRYLPSWRNEDTGDPKAYYLEGKTIGIYPMPNSNVTNGLKVFYYKLPAKMSSSTSDPFDDRTDLEPYHDNIILYMLWKAKQAIGEYLQADAAYKEYLGGVNRMILELGEQPDNDDPFRPYHQAPTIIASDPNYWGV